VAAHGDEADREQRDDQADDEVRRGGARTVPERDRQGEGAADAGERCLGGEDEEEDPEDADRPALELTVVG
jgi:hypothetical protein